MLKKTQMVILFTILLSSLSVAANTACPKEKGEYTSCQNEDKAVKAAFQGVVKDEEFNYCKLGTTTTDEISCRKIVTFKSRLSGERVNSVFEDWLIIALPETSSSPKSLLTIKFIFVQNSSGLYDVFIDDDPTSVTKVDKVLQDSNGYPIQTNIDVEFDSNNFPGFELPGLNVSTGETVILGIFYSKEEALVDFVGTGRLDTFIRLGK